MKHIKFYEEIITPEYEYPGSDIGKELLFGVDIKELIDFYGYFEHLNCEPRVFIVSKSNKYWVTEFVILFKYQPDMDLFVMNRSMEVSKLNRDYFKNLTKNEITDIDFYIDSNKYNL